MDLMKGENEEGGMYISRETAQEIVEEIGREIGAHINLMDEQGYIIASTDDTRIGNLHEGAKRIIQNHLQELYITEEMENSMTKKGINLPLVVEENVVGVVGITGDREKVYGYGNIVRRMTEILIADSIQKDAKRYERRQRYYLLEEWLENPSSTYSIDFQKRAEKMGIDVTKPYRVMILLFKEYQELSDSFEGQRLLEQMEATIRHEAERQRMLYLREPSRQICMLPWCATEHMTALAKKISCLVKEKYGRNLAVGYDSGREKHLSMRRCVYEAEKAATQALVSENRIVGYDELDVELFLNEVSYNTMEDYVFKLFGNIGKDCLKEYIKLTETYFFCEGSISKMADTLYIHKNTVQYKLKKMAEDTGKDIRRPSETVVYYMAWKFYQCMK